MCSTIFHEQGHRQSETNVYLFQRQRWGNFRETGWNAYGIFRARWSDHLDTQLSVDASSNRVSKKPSSKEYDRGIWPCLRETDRQTDRLRETGRQADRQTPRQRDRQNRLHGTQRESQPARLHGRNGTDTENHKAVLLDSAVQFPEFLPHYNGGPQSRPTKDVTANSTLPPRVKKKKKKRKQSNPKRDWQNLQFADIIKLSGSAGGG